MYLVNQAVRNVSMNLSIAKAENKVWPLRREYHNALRSAGYAQIMETKQHITVNHILRKLKSSQLYRRMLDIIG